MERLREPRILQYSNGVGGNRPARVRPCTPIANRQIRPTENCGGWRQFSVPYLLHLGTIVALVDFPSWAAEAGDIAPVFSACLLRQHSSRLRHKTTLAPNARTAFVSLIGGSDPSPPVIT